MNINHQIFVIENKDTNHIIGTLTILIEQKVIHNMGKVGHIEDVAIDNKYRGRGLGKLLIDNAISYCKKNDCYKMILNCKDYNKSFYIKCGFQSNDRQMLTYLKDD